MSAFEQATAVAQVSEHGWRGEIVPGWRIGEVPNGGYLLAIAGRVLSEALAQPDPLSLHILFTAPTGLGPIDCEVQPLREGGSTSFAALSMQQGGELKAYVTGCYSDLARLEGESWSSVERPEIPPPEAVPPLGTHGIELRESVNQHYLRGQETFLQREPDGSGVFQGWLSLADGSDAGVLGLLLFADAMAPPVFTVFGPLQWVPTLELSVQLRARPKPGPVQVRFQSRYLSDGVVEEDGELWDSDGRLVALSRQTSKVRVRPHPRRQS
jgi:acyl-CoA thioesterase